MKRISVVMVTGILSMFFQATVKAQVVPAVVQTKNITAHQLCISYRKTTNLIFPYAIKSVDRGSSDLMVQMAKGVENVLQVKAGTEGFKQTNLSVITSDGTFYSFLVDYEAEPLNLTITFGKESVYPGQTVQISDNIINDQEQRQALVKVLNSKDFMNRKTQEQAVQLCLKGIFQQEKPVMWFNLQVNNRSKVPYTPDFIRFFIKDRKRSKRSAIQEKELVSLYAPAMSTAAARQANNLVFAFPAFTIPRTQQLVIQMGERNGGRSLSLRLSHKILLKARSLVK